MEYLVKREGYGHEHSSWEHVAYLGKCRGCYTSSIRGRDRLPFMAAISTKVGSVQFEPFVSMSGGFPAVVGVCGVVGRGGLGQSSRTFPMRSRQTSSHAMRALSDPNSSTTFW